MKIWNDVGRNKTDAAVFEGIAMTNSGSSQNDAAQAVLQTAVALGYTPTEINAFVTHFQNTGYDVSVGIDYVSNAITDDCASDVTNENGLIEPGEVVDVAVTLQAAAFAHTGATGTLTSTTPGVTILDGTATWPTLNPGVPTASDAPHFRIAVDGSVTCLSTIDFQLSVTSSEGGPFAMAFARKVGQTLAPGGLPAAIPDNSVAGVTSTLNVGTNVTLTDVDVRVDLAHTWVGDLHVKLRSPAGTEVILLDRPGYPASSFGCGDHDINVTFDDAAALVPENHCAGTNPWLSGPARAVQGLSAFNGQSSLGNWVLTVSDRASQDVGTLLDWELITTPALPGVCDPCQSVAGIFTPGLRDRRVELGPNHPNPFSRSTEIAFQLARAGHANLRVYDVAGQVIATVIDRELPAGPHQATWDGRDRSGSLVASGLYFCRLTSDGAQGVRRMLLVR